MTSAAAPTPYDPIAVFHRDELQENAGVCALINDVQVAVFYLPGETPSVFALHNWDPLGKANVLYRGIVGDVNGERVIASPLYKQHFSLDTGRCLEDDTVSVPIYEAFLVDDTVTITLQPRHTKLQD